VARTLAVQFFLKKKKKVNGKQGEELEAQEERR
jgi:hypothetical protein